MAKRGRTVVFHGAFSSKADAVRKEKSVGGFIEKTTIHGKTRFVVMTKRTK
jgi:hypothetical protein